MFLQNSQKRALNQSRGQGYHLNFVMRGSPVQLFALILLLFSYYVQGQVSPVTCKSPSQDGSFCKECRDYYHLYEGQCFINILGCENYVFGNICRKCEKGFILVNNECCDKVCMSKVYREEHHASQVAENREEELRKAEVDGLEKSIAVVAKNSVKAGQDYDILGTRSQRFQKVFRYFVDLEVQGHQYTATNDYNIVTGEVQFVSVVLKGEPAPAEVTLTEENIHGNAIYEEGYKFVYEKYGLDLYELQFSRMSAIQYARSTELKFVFLGAKVLLITVMISQDGPYVLWKQERTNVQEVKEYVQNLKKVESITKEYNFKQVLSEVLKEKNYKETEVEVVEATPVSQEEYAFVIYHRVFKIRFSIKGKYSIKTKKVTLDQVEEVFSEKLSEMKEPEQTKTKVIAKESLSKSVEAKEVFDYLYKIQPTFRQNLVETIQVEEGTTIKKLFVLTKKDGKDYRLVVLKDQKTQTLQLVDEGYIVDKQPTATVINTNEDGTTTVTTSNIDTSKPQVQTLITALKKNGIDTTTTKIESMQYTENTKSIEYVAVLADSKGNAVKQVTISQDKQTKQTTLIDSRSLQPETTYVKPVENPSVVIPQSDYFKPEVKDLISKVESKVEDQVVISKVNKITVTNSTGAQKYQMIVEDSKGKTVQISAIQVKGETGVQVLRVAPYEETQTIATQTKVVKKVDQFGVRTQYTNDQKTLTESQNVNVAVTTLLSQEPELANYKVISVQTKDYLQQQEQIMILSNGTRSVQVLGHVDQKTLRYVSVEEKEIPVTVTYPVITQQTVLPQVYPVAVKTYKPLQDSEVILQEKYKIFKSKVPVLTTVETLEKVEIITFSYEINQKKFIAVVQYDKTGKESKILEVSPVEVTTKPVKVDQTTYEGKTVTTSNSAEEVQKINQNTDTVITTVLKDYPLLKDQNITEVTLTQSDYSDVFEITYTEVKTKKETTITVRTDKKGEKVTIEDVWSEGEMSQTVKVVDLPKVTLKEEDFSSEPVKKVVEAVNKTKVPVDKVVKVVTQKSPSYTTYNMQVQSKNKSFSVTVIDHNQTQEIVSIRSADQKITVPVTVKPAVVKEVDSQGNQVVKTNDASYISKMTQVTTVVEHINTIRQETTSWNVDSVITVDYGLVQGVTVTLKGSQPEDALTTTVFYQKQTKSVEVVSIEKATVQVQKTKEVFYGEVAPVVYPTVSIPDVAIPTAIKKDQSLSSVITYVQGSSTTYQNVLPVTTEVQQLSKTVTQYKVVMEVKEKKEQLVVIYNSETKQSKIITSSEVKADAKPYYVAEIETEAGQAVESNNVQQITAIQPEFPEVLVFSNEWLHTNQDWSEVKYIQVIPSTVKGGNNVYTLETSTVTEAKKIEVSYNTVTKEMTVINLQVTPVKIVYPSENPVIKIDPKQQPEEVKKYTQLIEKSDKTTIEVVKEVVSVSKVVTETEETIRTEVIGDDNKKYYVTIVKKEGEEPKVVNVEGDKLTKQESGAVVKSVDSNGNSVKEITGEQFIKKEISTSTSIEILKKTNSTLINYEPVSAKIVNLGPKDEVTVILKEKKTGDTVQATTIYDESNNQADVISVVPAKVPVGIIPAKEEVPVTGEVTRPEEKVSVPEYPTKNIPQILVPEVVKTDKSLEKVIQTVQQSDSSYQNVVPLSVKVESYSKEISKYTVVMEVEQVRKQIVTIYNATSATVKSISVKVIDQVKPVFNEQVTTQKGEIVYSSNNISSLMTKFTDLKFVYQETVKLVPEIDPQQVTVVVKPQDSINSYTIQTVKGNNKVTVELNYEVVSNRTYVTNYKVEPMAVAVPTQPIYYPEVLTVDSKTKYIETVKNSGIKEITDTINVVESKTTEYALYRETLLKIETQKDKTYYVKVIKVNAEDTPKVIDVTEAPEMVPSVETRETTLEVLGEAQEELGEDQTTVKTDTNGNVVTISTNEVEIVKNPAVNASVAEIIKKYPQYSSYSVKYVKTVNFGLMEEVMTTMLNPSTGAVDLQAVSFYNKETRLPKIVSIEPIKQPSIDEPAVFKPLYPSVVISDSTLATTIQKDVGLRSVLQTIQQSAVSYHTAIPLTVEVQQMGVNATTYVVVLEVSGQKEQKVYVYNKENKSTQHIATTIVPAVIVPKMTTSTVVENKKVTISNSVELVQQSHPETTQAVNLLIKDKPKSSIESVMVMPEGNTTEVTLITKNETTKEYTIEKYSATKKQATKVEDQVIKISDVAVPKQIVYTPVAPTILIQNPVLMEEVKKIVNADATVELETSKITSVTVSKNTNVQVYQIKAADANNKPVSIEIIYNPTTQETTVVDVSEVKTDKKIITTTITKETTGVSDVTTTNTDTIKQSKEYTQITDFLKKNHPEVDVTVVEPKVDQTEKYQRSVIKTVILQEETKTIQATFVINQRTQTVTELSYEELPVPEEPIFELQIKPVETVYKPAVIPQVVTKEKIVADTILAISKVDPTLKDLTPTYVEVKEYRLYRVITIVYDTPKSNSRLLTIYNQQTGEANVVDYTKVDKNILGSKAVETINEQGQTTYYTNNVTTTITRSEEYIEVLTVADELVPAIKNKPVIGFETATKSTGVQYKIVTVENGVVNQVTLQFNNETKEVVLISESQTSVATEIAKLVKKVEAKPKKIDLVTLQGGEIGVLVDQVVVENPAKFDKKAPIVSGSVVETDYAFVYELTLETKTEQKETVKITQDKTTKKVIVNDISPVIVRPALPPVTTVTKTDDNGNVETTTNDKTVIKESKGLQKTIEYIYQEKPQLAVLVPTATKTVTYGDIQEDTVVFTAEKQSSVQVTTITNTKTQTVTILDSRIIPVTYQPIKPAVLTPQTPIYALPIQPVKPILIKPTLPVQIIPTPILPIAIKKYPEIKEIVTSVQTSEGKVLIKQVSVEQFTSVKKYTAVTETAKGTNQMVYVYVKDTKEVKLIQTVPIPREITPVFIETKTNEKGEEVTTSTSVEQVVVRVPEVQTMVEELKKKYNIDVTTATKVVEVKGTTVKEIKIVVETQKKTEVVYTGIANGTVVKVVDVQETPEVVLKPIVPAKPVLPGTPTVVKPEVKKPVEEVVFAHPIIKEQYSESVVESFKSTETSFMNTYEVTVVNKKGEKAVVQLIQEPGQPIEIIHIDGKPTEVVKVSDEPVTTDIIVAPTTGNKIITTTDRQVIKTETSITHATQNIYAQLPNLIGYTAVKADSVTYGVSKQTSIIFASEGKTSVQVTVIHDTTTNKVEIVNTQPIQPEEKPKIQTIPGSVVTIASKKFVEIKTIISSIETTMAGSVTVEELQVKDLDQVKIYTPIIYSPALPEEKTQFVFVYNKGTKEIKQVDKVTIASEVKAITYEKKVDKFGQVVIQTNDVETAKEQKPEMKVVLFEIDKTYGKTVTQDIKTVKVTEQAESTEYQIVTEVKGTLQEVKVVKENGVVTVVGMQQSQVTSEPKVTEEKSAKEKEEVKTVETGGEAGTMVAEVIKTSEIVSLKEVEIVSIKSSETLLTTLYTVETKTKENEVQIVTISVAPEQKPQIVQIEPVKEPVKEVIVSESKKEKKVNEITGDVVTVTTEVLEVKDKAKTYTSQIIKVVPEVKEYTPVSVKTTESGVVSWTTIVYSGEEKSVQVTSLYNKTDQTVKVIDKKVLNKTVETGSQNVPETQIYVIPAAAITSTSKKLTEIATIVKEVSTTYKESKIESIEIEAFGETQKVVAVVETPSGKVDLEYLVNKATKEVKLIETVNVIETKEEFYSETINKYGETTIITNNVTELTSKIPQVEGGIEYIKAKYPVTLDKQVKIVKVIEYQREYQVNYVSQVDVNNPFAIVVSIDKETGTTRELTTYTKEDVETQKQEISIQIEPVKEEVKADAPAITTVVEYIEKIPDVPIKKIQNVTKAEKITTLFGTQVITIEATSTQNQKIKTVVNYNPITEEVTVNSFDVVAQPVAVKDVVTEFKVDTNTGVKQTVTNNPTVLASSEMMKTITEQVKIVDKKLVETVLTASITTEYPEKVKVVSIFSNETTKESVQVVSIFDKQTSQVQIMEIDQGITTPLPDVPKEVFTTEELPAAETSKPSIPATTVFINENYPQYKSQKPKTVIVETLEQVEFVSYIYQTVTAKEQIVVVYNKTSKQSKIVEVSPVAENIKPLFYEEKKTQEGQDIIVTNNLTEVKERIPTTEVLTTYLAEKTTVTVDKIETVELRVTDQYLDYTLVVNTEKGGVKQYEYLVNSETKEVKEVDSQVITEELPVVIPKKPVIKVVEPTSEEVKPVVTKVIDNPETKLNDASKIVNLTKETVSKGSKYEIEYTTEEKGVNKIVVLEDADKQVHVIDERPVKKDETPKKPIVIKDQIDETTKTETTVYPTVEAFKLDQASEEVTNYLYKAVSETSEYKIESIRKESFGHVQEYEILLKADKKAPIQVTIAKDEKNKNIVVLEKKKITEDEVQSVLDGSVVPPATVEVSDIEKENIKVLSKLGLVKDIKEYNEVSLNQMANNEQFTTATQSVKQVYSALLSTAVIVRVLEKKTLESNNVKVFYKAKDQIYEASIEMNEITGQTKLTEFIKVGTQSYPKSEVNVYSDLCYGYQLIEDFSLDSNIDFITTYLRQKHDSLKDASLIEAQEIILQNGRINYKLYYKKDATTVKYIVYYEPEYKRVLEVKGTSFQIGNKYTFVEKSKQISDPYFRKLDTYIRQNRENLGAASVMHTQSKDDGQKIEFRTVYTAEGKTYRSIASINKDNQNIDETSLSEVIEVPVEETYVSQSECSTQTAKLDIHDLGKNTYFTECYKYIQDNYQKELASGQLLGASEKTNYNIYTYVFYFIIDETKIITLTVEFDPLSQAITVSSEPANIDLQDGYYPVRSDKKLTQVRNWLKDNNPDLSSSVLISSMGKKFYFGTLYKIVFKVTTKYIVYVAYVECGSKDVKIYDTQQLDSYTATPVTSVEANGFVGPSGGDDGFVGPSGGDDAAILGGDQGMVPPSGGDTASGVGMESKLKGFARPTSA